jgi:hypothetical protein
VMRLGPGLGRASRAAGGVAAAALRALGVRAADAAERLAYRRQELAVVLLLAGSLVAGLAVEAWHRRAPALLDRLEAEPPRLAARARGSSAARPPVVAGPGAGERHTRAPAGVGPAWSTPARREPARHRPASPTGDRPAPPTRRAPASPTGDRPAPPTRNHPVPPTRCPPGGAPAPGISPPPSPAQPLDVNRATAAELARLPGIGPRLAARLLARREALGGSFGSFEDFARTPGLGRERAADLRPLVWVSDPPSPPEDPGGPDGGAPRLP